MPLSYNQIIKQCEEFVEAHYVLKGFGNGFFYKVVESDQVQTFKYPLMYMEDLSSTFGQGVETFSFRVHFMNLVAERKDPTTRKIETNFNEVKSDMRQCAKDFLAFWAQDRTQDDLDIDKVTTATFFEDETEDRLTGCYIEVTFRQRFTYNKCIIPSSNNSTN